MSDRLDLLFDSDDGLGLPSSIIGDASIPDDARIVVIDRDPFEGYHLPSHFMRGAASPEIIIIEREELMESRRHYGAIPQPLARHSSSETTMRRSSAAYRPPTPFYARFPSFHKRRESKRRRRHIRGRSRA